MFDTHRGYLLNAKEVTLREKITETTQTSAIIIRRNAFAIDASTPTISNSTDRFESRWTLTFNFYLAKEALFNKQKKILAATFAIITHLFEF